MSRADPLPEPDAPELDAPELDAPEPSPSGPARQGDRRWWAPSLLLLAAIWTLSSLPDTPGPALPHPLDWLAHALTYLALGYSLARATGSARSALVLVAWWGALDEVHQAFVPQRDAGIEDWLFDLLGGLVGVGLARRQGKA